MKILKDHSLKNLNAFHVDVKAKYVAFIDSQNDLSELLSKKKYKTLKKCILGESSGTLFKSDFDGLVIKVDIKGIETQKDNKNSVVITTGAGVVWDDLVIWTINKNLQGIENLSGIPGSVGAAPVQNIAAYGQEFAKVFVSLKAVEIKSGKIREFKKEAIKFILSRLIMNL